LLFPHHNCGHLSLHDASTPTDTLQTLLSPSGVSPLTLAIDWYGFEDERVAAARFDTIILQSHRWHEMALNLCPSEYMLLAPVKGHLPKLEELHLVAGRLFHTPICTFEIAPRLHTVTVSHFTCPSGQLNACFLGSG
jgi:hypothetical protein